MSVLAFFFEVAVRFLLPTDVVEDRLRFVEDEVFLVAIHPSPSVAALRRDAALMVDVLDLLLALDGNLIVICALGLVKNCSARSVHLR